MIFPLEVLQIETTNVCNARCIFCIHKDLKKFGTMSNSLFLKILKDAEKIDSIKIVVPMLLGEPFCDRQIIHRLQQINTILPDKQICLFTNCSMLTPDLVKDLYHIKNLKMFFSLNGTRNTRKKLMGLDDYEQAVKMIDLYKKSGKPYVVQLVKYPSVSNEELEDFKTHFPKHIIVSYKNWSGDKFTAFPKTGCNRAIHEMTVMNNGKVNLCCMEYGKVIFGDLNKNSVKEIWESKKRQEYCNKHSKGIFMKGVCSNCTKA